LDSPCAQRYASRSRSYVERPPVGRCCPRAAVAAAIEAADADPQPLENRGAPAPTGRPAPFQRSPPTEIAIMSESYRTLRAREALCQTKLPPIPLHGPPNGPLSGSTE
jgi:hypothetical protein